MSATPATIFVYQPAKAVRFLAARWRCGATIERHSSMLLEPIIRFSDLGVPGNLLIDDTAIMMCIAIEDGAAIRVAACRSTVKTLQERGWSLPALLDAVAAVLRGEEPAAEHQRMFPDLEVMERQIAFAAADECREVLFDYLDEGKENPCPALAAR